MNLLLRFPIAFILVLMLFISACANGNKLIKQAKVYYYPKQQGNVQVDSKGNEIHVTSDTVIVAIVEASSKLIEWDSAWVHHKLYRIESVLLKSTGSELGTEKLSKEKAAISAAEGNYLYELHLAPVSEIAHFINGPVEDYPLFFGKYKGKVLQKKGSKPVEVEPIPAM